MVAISDEHVRTVRALLLDQYDFDRRSARLQQTHDLDGYRAMITGLLFQLTNRRFAPSRDQEAALIRWVAKLRAIDTDRRGKPFYELNAAAAEQLLGGYLGLPSNYAEYDEETRAVTQYTVMMALYEDLALTEDELDQLLVEAREAVEQTQE